MLWNMAAANSLLVSTPLLWLPAVRRLSLLFRLISRLRGPLLGQYPSRTDHIHHQQHAEESDEFLHTPLFSPLGRLLLFFARGVSGRRRPLVTNLSNFAVPEESLLDLS